MGNIFVIETEDDALLGTVEFVNGGLLVRTGFVGHPTFVKGEDIVKLVPAEDHELVEQYTVAG